MMTTEQWYEAGCPPEWAICYYRIDEKTEECGTLATHTLTLRDDDGLWNAGACPLHAALASAILADDTAEHGELLAVRPASWSVTS